MWVAIRKRAGDFAAILVLLVLAVAVGGYILANERLHFPFIQQAPFKLKAAFSTAQAVTPGQGQTVRVSGVRIGDISDVKLDNGQAIVSMDIDHQYKNLVHTDASALLRPKTGLKDMFIELNPGTSQAPVAKQNWTVPVQNTLPDVNPDEVYSALDADTRAYVKLLVNGAGQGLQSRGSDLQEVFRRFEPTNRDIARVTTAVAVRRHNLRRLINSLQRLNTALAQRGGDLRQLISASATVFRAFASEDTNISRAIRDFPGALRTTTSTLGKVQTFADVLRPTADKLRPAVRELNVANHAVRPFVIEAAPIIRHRIRPFVRAARPVVRSLNTPARQLATATPNLTTSFQMLNHLFDLIGYNPNGREAPGITGRDEGYLFYIAWITHQTEHLFTTGDAHGSYRPVFVGAPCGILANIIARDPSGAFSNLNLFGDPNNGGQGAIIGSNVCGTG
jgi:phospholipid/cholesterol/gamma-HCH transport system substrate-binding protein